ncbi:MAG: DNA mismatch repair endonuclease MutL, partial [Clostridia bacterium]|nr:DNA mismatch repair endonuclease MutL [Clostridia bacterium]
MPVINVLSKQVAELIAAGEVIERPASVIKELVENSIDAGARSIIVEIKNGGVTFMRVTDDGSGIEHDDVRNAFLRHATSKIAVSDDLDSIATLGFRGEALASICAVSRVELITRSSKEETGTVYKLEGGEETLFSETGCAQGTTFVVRDLFYNVPARMKFLKKDAAESNTVSTLLDRMALSHPEIGFTFIRDGRQVMKTSGNGDLKTTVFQVFGKQFFDGLIPVSYEFQGITLSGFISDPVSSNRANRNMQIFFVNGRYVRTKTGAAALDQAYKGFIMVGKYPACVLEMKMNCSTLDVNVHPAKLEIRFTNERPVYDCIYHGVRTALSEYDTRNNSPAKTDRILTDPSILGKRADRGSQLSFVYGRAAAGADQEPEVFSPPAANFSADVLNDSSNLAGSWYRGRSRAVRSFDIAGLTAPAKEKPAQDFYAPDAKLSRQENESAAEPDSMAGLIKDTGMNSAAPVNNKDGENEPAAEELTEQPACDTAVNNIPEETAHEAEAGATEYLPQDTENSAAEQTAGEPVGITENENMQHSLRYVGEAFSTYIIIEYDEDRLMFIDKHAAHERLIYERLKRSHKETSAQLLLEPVIITLDKAEMQSVIENRELLMDAGFEVEEFGSGTVLLRSVPALLEKLEITEAFLEIADYLAKHKKLVLTEKMEWIYANTACRAAIKAGNISKPEELMELVRELESNPEVRYCPHGRPIYFFMS